MTYLVKPDMPWVSIRVKGAMRPTVDRLTSSQQVKDGSFSVVVAARSSDYPSSGYDAPQRHRTASRLGLPDAVKALFGPLPKFSSELLAISGLRIYFA